MVRPYTAMISGFEFSTIMADRAASLALMLGVAGLVAAGAASAATGPRAATIEEVVVTARKREESIQDVPLSVTAYTGEELARQGVYDLTQLDQQVPSLSIGRSQGSPTGIDITLRGITAADDLLTTDRAVGLYMDGIVVPHPFAFASNLFDLESVEVLKGPQGTLFGKNTIGGAVNVRARRPDYDGIHGYVSGDIGNFSNRDVSAAVNIPLVPDRAAMRLAAQVNKRDGYGRETGRTYCGTDDGTPTGNNLGADGFFCYESGNARLGDDDEWAVRGSFIFDPTDRLHVSVVIDHTKIQERGNIERAAHWYPFEPGALQIGYDLGILDAADLGALFAGVPSLETIGRLMATDAWVRNHLITDDVFRAPTGGPGTNRGFAFAPGDLGQFPNEHKFADAETTGFMATIEYELANGMLLKSVTGFRNMEVTRSDDIDGTLFIITDAPLDTESDVFVQELTLSGTSFEDSLDWVAGLYYDMEDGSDGSRAAAVPAFNPNNRNVFDFDVENESWAVFAQGTYAVTDRLRFTAGVRYTEEDRKYISRNRTQSIFAPVDACSTLPGVTSGPDGAECEISRKTSAEEWSWLFSLDYDITDSAMAYVKTSRGFRGGAFSGRAPTAPPVEPEIATDIELGLKAAWWDGRIRTNAAIYRTNYDERQVTVILRDESGTAFTLLQNAAETEIDGAELEVTVLPIDGLTLRATASWINSTWESFVGQSQANCFLPAGPALPDDVIDGTPGQFRGPCSRLRDGDKVNGERPWTYSLHGRYEAPFGDLGILGVQADWSWIDRARGDKYDSLLSPVGNRDLRDDLLQSRGWLNARIDFDVPRHGLNIALYGTNLLDKEDIVPSADVSLSYAGVLVREPRFYGLRVRKSFGTD
jgi:iron complex outermembrane recepter protein